MIAASEVNGVPATDGSVLGHGYLSEGEHALLLHAQDPLGKTSVAAVVVKVNGPNRSPECAFTAPSDGETSEGGTSVMFEGSATDPDIPADLLSVNWTSSLDGLLGSSVPVTDGRVGLSVTGLSVGTHLVTMTVTDDVGASCSSLLKHTVGTPPTVSLISPSTGSVFNAGVAVEFTAVVGDAESRSEDLSLLWSSNIDGALSTTPADSAGVSSFSSATLSAGDHLITLGATDPDGQSGSDALALRINSLPGAPTVSLSPDPATTSDDLAVTIDSPSTDPDGDPIVYTYHWTRDGVASTASVSATLSASATAKGEV